MYLIGFTVRFTTDCTKAIYLLEVWYQTTGFAFFKVATEF